jgi:hypothetical protein
MSNITSIVSESPLLTSTISATGVIGSSTFSEGGRTLSELTDVDLQGTTGGSLLVYDTNKFVARTLSGDATINSDGVLTINPNLVTLSLPQALATTSSPTFNNITLSGVINNAYEWTFGADGKLTLPNALTFDNGAKLRKGTTDAGNGGNNGIALECSAQYELKWDAGRLYTMQQDGFTIRRVDRCYNIIPTAADDSTKGFVVGSLWVLDDGIAYVCVDNTLGSAVWNCMTSNAGQTILAAADHPAQITALSNITDISSTTINLTAADSGKILRCTSSSAVTINMPSTDPAGNFTVAVIQAGVGMVTFAANNNTLNSYNSVYSIAGQHAWASVIRVAPNTYNLSGTLS